MSHHIIKPVCMDSEDVADELGRIHSLLDDATFRFDDLCKKVPVAAFTELERIETDIDRIHRLKQRIANMRDWFYELHMQGAIGEDDR